MASFSSIMFGFMPTFFHSQLLVTPPSPTTDCTGKTIIVTGANTGLGKEAARHYVRLNAEKVIIACRTLGKGEAAKRDIETSTGRKNAVDVWQLDLSSYESVKQFAEKAKTLQRLDSIVENAGINTSKYEVFEDNESTITVNVVSTFLLALLMIPILQRSGRKNNITPTLTIVSSEVHAVTPFPEGKEPAIFTALNDKNTKTMSQRYLTSKLLEVYACRQIAKDHPVEQLKVGLNFVNPGWCHSDLVKVEKPLLLRIFMRIMCRATEVGSRPLVHAGLNGPKTHGKYLSNCKPVPPAPFVEGPGGAEMQQKVWKELASKLEEIQPGILKVLDA